MTDKYDYDRFGQKAKRVGQAVQDILNTSGSVLTTVEDVVEGYKEKFTKEIEDVINKNTDKYEDPFYVLVLTKKESWAANVVRNWFIARQTKPKALEMMSEYSNHTKTLYRVNKYLGTIEVEWSLPSYGECISVLKTPLTYDHELVKWITDCFSGTLDKE